MVCLWNLPNTEGVRTDLGQQPLARLPGSMGTPGQSIILPNVDNSDSAPAAATKEYQLFRQT